MALSVCRKRHILIDLGSGTGAEIGKYLAANHSQQWGMYVHALEVKSVNLQHLMVALSVCRKRHILIDLGSGTGAEISKYLAVDCSQQWGRYVHAFEPGPVHSQHLTVALSVCRKRHILIDLGSGMGAEIGKYLAANPSQRSSIHVHAFEPSPVHLQHLKAALARHQLQPQVTVHEAAAWVADEQVWGTEGVQICKYALRFHDCGSEVHECAVGCHDRVSCAPLTSHLCSSVSNHCTNSKPSWYVSW